MTEPKNEILISDLSPAVAALSDEKALQAMLDLIEKDVLAEHLSVSDQKGRDRIKSLAYKVARTKTAWDDAGAELVAAEKAKVAAIDKRRKAMRDRMDALKAKVRKPLDDWEAKDADRKAAHRTRIDTLFKSLALPLDSASLIALRDERMAVEIDERWEEFENEARKAKDDFLRYLSGKITDAQLAEERARQQAEENEAREKELADLRAKVAAMAATKPAAEAPQPEPPPQETSRPVVGEARDTGAVAADIPAPVPPAMSPEEREACRAIYLALRGLGLSVEASTTVTNAIQQGRIPNLSLKVNA